MHFISVEYTIWAEICIRQDLNPGALIPTVRDGAAAEPLRRKGRVSDARGSPMWDPHNGGGRYISHTPHPYMYSVDTYHMYVYVSYIC